MILKWASPLRPGVLVSASFLRHDNETKTLLSTEPSICLKGLMADNVQILLGMFAHIIAALR